MLFSSIALRLSILPAALSAILPGSIPLGKDAHLAKIQPIFEAAAAKSIDLTKAPAWKAVPALNLTPITPGPGLPSLEELKLTWADLVKDVEPEITSTTRSFEKRYSPYCYGGPSFPPVLYNDALWCYNYLNGLGSTSCTVPATGRVRMCTSGSHAAWYGHSISGTSQTSTCAQVAGGGKWVLDNCKVYLWGASTGNLDPGTNAAWGNGMLIVDIHLD